MFKSLNNISCDQVFPKNSPPPLIDSESEWCRGQHIKVKEFFGVKLF